MSCLMDHRCRWPASNVRILGRSSSKINPHFKSLRMRMTNKIFNLTSLASVASTKWLLNPSQNQTSKFAVTSSRTSSCQEAPPWWKASRSVFKSNYQTSVPKMWKWRYWVAVTASSFPGSVDPFLARWAPSSRCGWAGKSMKSMELLWLKENVHEINKFIVICNLEAYHLVPMAFVIPSFPFSFLVYHHQSHHLPFRRSRHRALPSRWHQGSTLWPMG